MATAPPVPRERARPAAPAAPAARTGAATRWLAWCALPLLAYEAWTLAGWLADGPGQVTLFRDHGSTSWYAARAVEALVLLSVAGWVAHVIREHRRHGHLSTDGLLIIGMFSAAFWDPVYNWLTPAWLYSSNFLNVNDWLAHAPLIANPDAGRMPWPVIIVGVGYPLWGVGFAALVNVAMRGLQRRRPDAAAPALVLLAFAVSGGLTVASFAVFRALDLMAAPGYRLHALADSELIVFFWSGGLVFGGLACLRFFRDDRGRTLVERGGRGAVNVLAAIAACQLIVITGWGFLTVPLSLHSAPYPPTPRHLINGLCDAPGAGATTYGPCPGSPGFRLPLVGS